MSGFSRTTEVRLKGGHYIGSGVPRSGTDGTGMSGGPAGGGISGGGIGLMSGGGLSMGSGGRGTSGREGCSIMLPIVAKSSPAGQTSNPTARIRASALLRSTTPWRIR